MEASVHWLASDQTDRLIEMMIDVIELARRDATGIVKNVSEAERRHWQQDAQEFLAALEDLKVDLSKR